MRQTIPPVYLTIAAALLPSDAAGQPPAFQVESEVTVRADSFGCKTTSELDRLLERNRTPVALPQERNCTPICKLTNALVSLQAARESTQTAGNTFASTIR
jgi:hypothetical protein